MGHPLTLSALFLLTNSLSAAPLTWDPSATTGLQGGGGTWDNATANWTTDAGATNILWSNATNAADTAVFGTAGGTVTVANTINLGGLTFTTAGYTLTGSSLNFGGALGTLDSSTLAAANQTIISNNLVGTGGLTIAANGDLSPSGGSSPGFLRLGGDNTGLTGGIAITAGVVDVLTNNSLGANTITLTNNAGIVDASHNLTLANNIVVGTGGGTIRLYSSATTRLNGVISGTGNLQHTDGGTLILNGTNTHTGDIANHAGTMEIGGSGSLNSGNYAGAILNSGTLRLNTTTNQTLSGVISGGGAFNKSNVSTTVLSGVNTFTGATTIAGGTLQIGGAGSLGSGNYAGAIANSGTFSFGSTAFQNLTGVISGAGNITQSAGVLTLGGVNTFTGKIAVTGSGNRFGINGDAALGAVPASFVPDAITLSAGTTFLNMTQASNNSGGFSAGFDVNLNANRGITLLGNATLQIGYGKTMIINGAISGTGSITHTDGGTLALNGVNTFTGNLTNSAGTLAMGGAGNTYTGYTHITNGTTMRLDTDNTLPDTTTVLMYGSTTFNVNGKTDTIGSLTTGSSGDTTATINLGTNGNLKITGNSLPAGLTTGYANATVAAKITGTGNIEYANATNDTAMWDLANSANTNDFIGNLTVTRGRLRFLSNAGADAALGNAANGIIFNGDVVNTLGNAQGKASMQVAAGSNATLGAGHTITLNTGKEGTLYTWGSFTFTVDGQITGGGNLRKEDSGILLLNNTSNNYTGETKIVQGTIQLGADEVLPNASLVRIGTSDASSPTLNLNGKSETVSGLSSVQPSDSAVLTNGTVTGGTLTVTGSTNQEYGGAFSSGTFRMNGTSTQTLSGTADNSGGTAVVSSGTLVLAKTSTASVHAVGAANAAGLTINGGTAKLGGTGGDQIYTLTRVQMNGGTFDFAANSEAFQSIQGAAGSVTNTGGATSTMTVGEGSTISDAFTFGGVIQDGSAPMALTKVGPGTQVLTAGNTYTGPTTVTAGTLSLSGGGALADSAPVSISTGATFNISGISGASEKVGALTGSAGSIIELGSKTLEAGIASDTTFGGVINGAGGSFTKAGAGTMTLNGTVTSTYSGSTSIIGGTLLLGSSDVLPDSASFSLAAATKFATGGNNETTGTISLSGPATLDLGGGSGTSVVTFANLGSWSGSLSILNWNGSLYTAGTTGINTRVVFNAGSFDAGQLGNIHFYSGGEGSPEVGTGAGVVALSGSTFELVAVPEPGALALSGSMILFAGMRRRRSLRK